MKNYEIDMCHGPLFGKILLFALPLIVTYAMQLLFNAADLIVIGHYSSHTSMAAIGATMNLNSLVINIFIGLSIGTNVLVARFWGANDGERVRTAVHTSMAVAWWGGLGVMAVGLGVAKPLLMLMQTPPEVLPLSCNYIWICFCGIPFIMIYNFGCAILRAVGDTRRPLIFLIIAGIINVLGNLFFVIVCKMDVAGVALATTISHGIAASLILRALLKTQTDYGLRLKALHVDWKMIREILKIGVPAGLQSSCFAVSNMIIQSSINSFGALAMAGTTATVSLEGIVYVASYAFHQTAISFVAQNLGGQQYRRIIQSLDWCFLFSIVSCSLLGTSFYFFGHSVLKIFDPNPEVIAWGIVRMKILFTTYGLCGIMDVASGGLRGLGYSIASTTVTLAGACLFRMWWVFAAFPHHRTMEYLMLSYPISWGLVSCLSCTMLVFAYRKVLRSKGQQSPTWRDWMPFIPRGFRFLAGPK